SGTFPSSNIHHDPPIRIPWLFSTRPCPHAYQDWRHMSHRNRGPPANRQGETPRETIPLSPLKAAHPGFGSTCHRADQNSPPRQDHTTTVPSHYHTAQNGLASGYKTAR